VTCRKSKHNGLSLHVVDEWLYALDKEKLSEKQARPSLPETWAAEAPQCMYYLALDLLEDLLFP
jgi:hypothetical protein